MQVTPLTIPDVKLLEPRRFRDGRGYFSETYNANVLEGHGIATEFIQDNESWSSLAGTIRGLHFQVPPMAQAKLVRVIVGAVFDVAVDIRRHSPTFGQHCSQVLSAENGLQLFIPQGFAHGFCTLEPGTIVAYKVDNYYAPECDSGIIWNDPTIAIAWPLEGAGPQLSDKDQKLPPFREQDSPF